MKDTVTISIERYDELTSIERDFKGKMQQKINEERIEWAQAENELANSYRKSWRQSEAESSNLRIENGMLKDRQEIIVSELEQSKRINFYIGGAFLISLILLISSILLQ